MRRLAALVLVAMTALVAAACTLEPDRPTVEEAGRTLKSHIDGMMKRVRPDKLEVTDPLDGDIPCGEGKAKRTYAVKGEMSRHRTRGDRESMVTKLIGGLRPSRTGYDPSEDSQEDIIAKWVNPQLGTMIELDSPAPYEMVATGTTECLETS